MSDQKTLKDLHSVTSLRESEDGVEHYNSQDGVQTDLFGQEVLHVNPSQQQGKEKERMTSDISGLSSLISSESANLQQCLVNKLQQLSDMDGSMIYKTTLKQKATPQQRLYYHLAASARTTKGIDSSSPPNSWPTPRAADTNNLNNSPTVVQARVTKGRATVAEIASHNVSAWPTASQRDYKGGYKGGRIRNGKVSVDTLDVAAQLSGLTQKSSTAETENIASSQLNPRFSLWLMGYPIEWAFSGERVTPLSRKRQQK